MSERRLPVLSAGGMREVFEETVWSDKNVAILFRRVFPRGRLIVAANRLPYAVKPTPHGPRWSRPAGGLAAALIPVMRSTGGVWVGTATAGDPVIALLRDGESGPSSGRFRLMPVPLEEEVFAGFYGEYANSGLWPLAHLLVERARFSASAWESYRRVNLNVAEAVAREAQPGDFLWLHDYHFALAPGLLRSALPAATVAFFWHIPWPPHEVLRLCPQRRDILEGLLGADLVGFHVAEYAHRFLDCVARELGARVSWNERGGTVYRRGRVTAVSAFPVSIDYDRVAGLSRSPDAARRAGLLRRVLRLDGQLVGIAVDRLDHTKGILQRLEAVETFFARYPQFRKRVTFLQVVAPSRTGIDAYRRLGREVRRRVAEINHRFGAPGWKPIRHYDRLVEEHQLVALYRLADVALVTPLFDGMNLVAKEFVACQQAEAPGVLLLSDTTGASREMAPPRTVNPLDPGSLAEAIAQALMTPPKARWEEVAVLQRHISRHNVFRWAGSIIKAAAAVIAAKGPNR